MSKRKKRNKSQVVRAKRKFPTARSAMRDIEEKFGVAAHQFKTPMHDAHWWRWNIVRA